MAVFSDTSMTLVEYAQEHPDKMDVKVVDACTVINQPLNELTWKECSDGDFEVAEITTTLGSASTRGYNQGIALTKGGGARVVYPTTMKEAISQIDIDLDRKSPAQRKKNDNRVFQGIVNGFMSSLIYDDNATDPTQVKGIFSYMNDTAQDRVISAGSATSNISSILVGCWGDLTGTCIFPENSTPGLKVTDKGAKDIMEVDASLTLTGKKYYGLETHFKWDYGFALYDDRYFCRICNIDISDLTSTTAIDLALIIQALNKIPNHNAGKMSIWMNSYVKTLVDVTCAKQTNLLHTETNNYGQLVSYLHGIPIRICNAMTITETHVTT
jgi:hypothetical protein